jgi:AcrR family transcriptional regulator
VIRVTTQAEVGTEPRIPLSRERVLRAAVKVADDSGIESLTMRRLAEELGAEAMSLYYHVAKKEDVLNGIAEVVAGEINDVVDRIDAPARGADWKAAVRRRILSAREVVLRHPWAPGVFETRTTMSPAVLRYHDRLVGLMRDGGFSYDLAHRALHVLGSRSLGCKRPARSRRPPLSCRSSTHRGTVTMRESARYVLPCRHARHDNGVLTKKAST